MPHKFTTAGNVTGLVLGDVPSADIIMLLTKNGLGAGRVSTSQSDSNGVVPLAITLAANDIIRLHAECSGNVIPYVIRARFVTDGPVATVIGDYGGAKTDSSFTLDAGTDLQNVNSKSIPTGASASGKSIYERSLNLGAYTFPARAIYKDTSLSNSSNVYLKTIIAPDHNGYTLNDVNVTDGMGYCFMVNASNQGYCLGMCLHTPGGTDATARTMGIWRINGSANPVAVLTEAIVFTEKTPVVLEVLMQGNIFVYLRDGMYIGSKYDGTYSAAGVLGLWLSGGLGGTAKLYGMAGAVV